MLAPTRFYSDTERMLITQLLLSGDVFCRAISERAPNEICEHVLSNRLFISRFYHDSHVLSEQDLQKRGDWDCPDGADQADLGASFKGAGDRAGRSYVAY